MGPSQFQGWIRSWDLSSAKCCTLTLCRCGDYILACDLAFIPLGTTSDDWLPNRSCGRKGFPKLIAEYKCTVIYGPAKLCSSTYNAKISVTNAPEILQMRQDVGIKVLNAHKNMTRQATVYTLILVHIASKYIFKQSLASYINAKPPHQHILWTGPHSPFCTCEQGW